jgi:hypothetical protein
MSDKQSLKLVFNYQSRLSHNGTNEQLDVEIALTPESEKAVTAVLGRGITISGGFAGYKDEAVMRILATHAVQALKQAGEQCDPVVTFLKDNTSPENPQAQPTAIELTVGEP